MRLQPELETLRGDPASQRRTQEEMEWAHAKWVRSPTIRELTEAIEAYAQGGDLMDCASLSHVMQEYETALALIDEWVGHFGAALAKEKLGLIPFRHSSSDGLYTLQLIAKGQTSLSLVTYEEKPVSRPSPTAVFGDRTQHEIIIAGAAHGYLQQRDAGNGKIVSRARSWSAGDRIQVPDDETSREICRVDGRLVVLQLVRVANEPRPTCEYRLEDGVLLHRSCADKQASQAEMALAVLGEMGRADAVPAMAEMAKAGPDHLRWEAVRHALALDPLAGVEILTAIAGNTADQLHEPAERLRNQLKQAHPQLFAKEHQRCPV